MTLQEYDRVALQLSGRDLVFFVNDNSEMAHKWMQEVLKVANKIEKQLDKETSKKIWNNILQMIDKHEEIRNNDNGIYKGDLL